MVVLPQEDGVSKRGARNAECGVDRADSSEGRLGYTLFPSPLESWRLRSISDFGFRISDFGFRKMSLLTSAATVSLGQPSEKKRNWRMSEENPKSDKQARLSDHVDR